MAGRSRTSSPFANHRLTAGPVRPHVDPMNWQDLNTTPCGILRNGEPRIIGIAGEHKAPDFLWYWVGDMNIAVLPGAKLEPITRAVVMPDTRIHGWISPLADMPEITDINQAMEEHRNLAAQAALPDFGIYLEEQIRMAVNGIKAGPMD